ncbi:MAG: hypothetical protein JNM17_41090 [Archangium sp.]|nr:hypothetical protein [Archangium sp.]
MMRYSRTLVCLLLAVSTVSTVAIARPQRKTLLDEPIQIDAPLKLAEYHGAAPLGAPRPISPAAPVVRHARADLFLLGLGLAAGGLVLGGAGFAVLYVCYAGGGCSDGITVLGWLLAAPGIIPLTVGLIMMYASSGSSGRVTEAPKVAPLQKWSFGFAPLKDGGFVSAGSTF